MLNNDLNFKKLRMKEEATSSINIDDLGKYIRNNIRSYHKLLSRKYSRLIGYFFEHRTPEQLDEDLMSHAAWKILQACSEGSTIDIFTINSDVACNKDVEERIYDGDFGDCDWPQETDRIYLATDKGGDFILFDNYVESSRKLGSFCHRHYLDEIEEFELKPVTDFSTKYEARNNDDILYMKGYKLLAKLQLRSSSTGYATSLVGEAHLNQKFDEKKKLHRVKENFKSHNHLKEDIDVHSLTIESAVERGNNVNLIDTLTNKLYGFKEKNDHYEYNVNFERKLSNGDLEWVCISKEEDSFHVVLFNPKGYALTSFYCSVNDVIVLRNGNIRVSASTADTYYYDILPIKNHN